MGSRKPQAKAKQVAAFKSSLGGMDSLFTAESRRTAAQASARDAARERKACTSKNRYDSREDAEEAARTCTTSGRRALSVYRCDYCDGWHLTSHPWD